MKRSIDPKDRLTHYTIVDGCWEFSGPRHDGYGYVTFHQKKYLMHRISYEQHIGTIPNGLFVLHKCNNRCCINPEHLYAGTKKQNAEDSIRAGTFVYPTPRFGEKNPNAKLTHKKVDYIRQSPKLGKDIAEELGISPAQVSRIRTGKRW